MVNSNEVPEMNEPPEREDYPGQLDDVRRERIVQEAVSAADHVIMEGSNGDTEETDYLTGAVMLKLYEKVQGRLSSVLLRRDLEKRHG